MKGVFDMATSTFERKIELKTKDSINKLNHIMNSEVPKKAIPNHPFSTKERNRSEVLLKQYLSR